MAYKKTADSGTNETRFISIPADQAEYSYKRDRAQTMTFAKMQELLQRNVSKNVSKTFT
jgi:hypothetical protein